jgi:hypothetical protein
MSFNVCKSQIKTIKQSNPNFLIRDGFTIAPRAGFEISNSCPYEYLLIIDECLKNGWLKPVANVTEKELMFIGLTNE